MRKLVEAATHSTKRYLSSEHTQMLFGRWHASSFRLARTFSSHSRLPQRAAPPPPSLAKTSSSEQGQGGRVRGRGLLHTRRGDGELVHRTHAGLRAVSPFHTRQAFVPSPKGPNSVSPVFPEEIGCWVSLPNTPDVPPRR